MEKQRGGKKGETKRQRNEEEGDKRGEKGKLRRQRKGRRERQRSRPTVKGLRRREKAPSLKAGPQSCFHPPTGTTTKWEAQRSSRDWQCRWVTLETRAREMGTGRGTLGRREEGERPVGWRPATGPAPSPTLTLPPHPEVEEGLGTEAKECDPFEWGKGVRGTKNSRNKPKEA